METYLPHFACISADLLLNTREQEVYLQETGLFSSKQDNGVSKHLDQQLFWGRAGTRPNPVSFDTVD